MRYVVVDATGAAMICDSLIEARDCASGPPKPVSIYELGPEVTEPDPTALVEWVQERVLRTPALHLSVCEWWTVNGNGDCTCGLTPALKKAGIRE